MDNHIVVSIAARDLVASGPGTVGADPAYSNLQVTREPTGYVEWQVHLPAAGRWRLHVQMAAAVRRPCALTVNDEKRGEAILGEVTGGWQGDRLQWFVYGPYDFHDGENRFRIDFTGGQPHLKEFGFSKVEPVELTLPWTELPDTRSLAGVAVLRDGTLLGVGTDRTLSVRTNAAALSGVLRGEPTTGEWTQVPGSGEILAAVELRDGTLLAVGADRFLRARATPASPWVQVPSSGAVVAVTVLHDGTILGVGVDKHLYTRAALTSPWVPVPGSGDMIGALELADGTILGVGTDKLLHARATLTDRWTPIPDSGEVVAVAELPDGALAGVKANGRLCVAGRIRPAAEAALAASPTARGESLHATGLEDYGYWLRWKQSLPSQGTGDGRPFRRGVVWR